MEIRFFQSDDYDKVYQLWINTPGIGLNDLDDSQEGIEKFLKRNPNTCFVAADKDNIIGIILCGHDGRRGYIYHTVVSAEFRKQGIGKSLLERVLEALEAEGINKIALVAFAKNEMGNEFWEAQGFTVRNDLNYRNKSLKALRKIDT